MPDEYITEIVNQATTLQTSDLFVVETGISGTPETKTVDWTHLETLILDFMNYQIVPSVASNNLTLAIKARDGNDFSATNSGKMRIGNTLYGPVGSISFTKNAGTNWCNAGSAETAAKDIDFFVYAIGETGGSAGLKFGFSRLPYGKTMADFSNTSTNEKYIASNITNFNAADAVTNIGRFRAQLSATAAFNWSIPSPLVVNRPIYETDWLQFTSIITYGGGTTSPTSLTINTAHYRIRGKDAAIAIVATLVRGTGNRTTAIFTVPFTEAQISPIDGMDSVTAAGLIGGAAIYIQTSSARYGRTMANDGVYYMNGSCELA